MFIFIIYGFLSIYILWLFYLAVMILKQAKDNGIISKPALLLGTPVLIIGYIIDAIVNFTVMSVLFLEPPFELTVTKRLCRHLESRGWKYKIAFWFCSNLLDTFDPSGKHCK